jgi:hypothetical protein
MELMLVESLRRLRHEGELRVEGRLRGNVAGGEIRLHELGAVRRRADALPRSGRAAAT